LREHGGFCSERDEIKEVTGTIRCLGHDLLLLLLLLLLPFTAQQHVIPVAQAYWVVFAAIKKGIGLYLLQLKASAASKLWLE
jgi:hypothetical protein